MTPTKQVQSAIIKSSHWVWNRLREARKYKIQLGEESVTDFLMLKLNMLDNQYLSVKSFNKHEESKNGAD